MRTLRLSQVKTGALLSYILIICNALYGIVITPFIIRSLGADQYGVYKTISALSSSMAIMDFGLGGTVQRYVAKYRADGKNEEIPNFIATALLISLALNALIIIVALVLCFLLPTIYGNTFTSEQLHLAKQLFLLMSANAVLVVVENVLNGLITGCNHFIFGNGLKLGLLAFRVGCLLLLLSTFKNALLIEGIAISVSVITFFAEILYIRKALHIRIRYTRWDTTLIKEAGIYTFLIFVTTVANQIFSNLDNVVLGAMVGPEVVTVYSVGLLLFGMFENLSVGISGVMLPTVTNALADENGMERATDVIIKAGKVQFAFLGAAFAGFVCIGRDFLNVWMGPEYDDVYVVAIILMLPAMVVLCTNVCHSVLRAQNKLGVSTVLVISSAVSNAIMTVIFVKFWSYYGAAIATAVSYTVFNIFAMTYYYAKYIGIPMKRIFASIFRRLLPCVAVAGGALFLFSRFVYGSWLAIACDVVFFCIIYFPLLIKFGFDEEEKKQIPVLGKLYKK